MFDFSMKDMSSATRSIELIYKGIRNPNNIPPYLKRKLFPSKYSQKKVEDGVVTWNTEAGFDWGDGNTPPQIAAINYHMVQALRKDLNENEYQHAVEIGCGYGRVTPWLSEFAHDVTGVDPNENVLSIVEKYYPNINTVCSKAQNLPIPENDADLLFTRSVLQHVPQEEIQQIVNEMQRIAGDDAHILICEATEGSEGETFHPRSETEYSDLLSSFKLESSWRRDAPAKTRDHTRTRMFFKRK